ncbi:MAG TPA: hypothetical protein VHM28_00215 [Anaerolineales bacterium]|nr:hypothetical protein [Anaerolineales bacterium]
MDSTTIHDAASVGVAKYLEWKQTFLQQWNERIQLGQLAAAFAQIPPELKEAMKQVDPAAYAQIAEQLSK